MRGERRRSDLTSREREVLELVRIGLTNEEIAQRLDISPDTAKFHVSQILSKLGVATREEAASIEPPPRSRWRRLGAWALGAAAVVVLAGVGVLAWRVAATGAGSDSPPESVQVIDTATPTATPLVTPGGPLIPDCGTAEERVAGGNVTLAEAQMLVDACLRAYTPGSHFTVTPSADQPTPVTWPLQAPYTMTLSNGKPLTLPAGSSIGESMGWFADLTYICFGQSVVLFDAATWKPYVSNSTYVFGDDRAAIRAIVEQLAVDFPEYASDYQSFTESFLMGDLPDQSPIRTPQLNCD